MTSDSATVRQAPGSSLISLYVENPKLHARIRYLGQGRHLTLQPAKISKLPRGGSNFRKNGFWSLMR